MLTKEAKRIYQLRWISERRRKWIEANGPCAVCGSTVDLEVDHIDPSLKSFPVSAVWSLGLDNPKRVSELAKCQVLCYTCHKRKSVAEQTAEHGVGTSGVKLGGIKCGCDKCLLARRRYQAEWRRNKRSMMIRRNVFT